jgi:hypothetical protein
MKNITKILLVLVSSLSISFAAVAGELTLTGAAKASYVIGGATDSQSKGVGVGNELNATASGEMDNGFTWSYSMELDPADGGAATNDDSQLVIGMGNLGTIGFFDSEGGLSQELAYGIGALGTGTDWGNTMTIGYGIDVASHPNIQYHLPADLLPLGMTAKVGYAPNMTDGQGNSFKNSGPANTQADAGNQMTGYSIGIAPMDGLSIAADYHDVDGQITTSVQKAESGNIGAQYAIGNFKVGYNRGYYAVGLSDKNTAISKYENNAYGIEFAINDSLSISYNNEKSEAFTDVAIASGKTTGTKTSVESEMETMQVAYIFGGATLGVHIVDVGNADYTSNKEEKKTIFTIAMDF